MIPAICAFWVPEGDKCYGTENGKDVACQFWSLFTNYCDAFRQGRVQNHYKCLDCVKASRSIESENNA